MNFTTCAAGFLLSPFTASCIQDEVPNVEAAIATMLGGPDTGATDFFWLKKN